MRLFGICPFAVFLAVSASYLQAATLDGSFVTTTQSTTWDLTALGTDDWEYWSTTASSFDGSPTNFKSGGNGSLSDLYAVGGGGLRGTGSSALTDIHISYTDGSSPTSADASLRGAFNSQLSVEGAGVGLDITLPTTDTYEVKIFTGGYFDSSAGSVGTFTATLDGATTYTDSSLISTVNNPKAGIVYTLLVTPDSANDVLSVSMVLSSRQGTNGNQHTYMAAVTVSQVPEPATYALFAGLAMLGLAVYFRRR
ncbi:PEP-CTERM sorting domain-containing protein [Cerasicoccus maritimus]|uniref:PEP-CTERM sorting domain-containing protein n=1 Tax=Cerasicoccus maritimus TaxID=490089 RepID=UPI00285258B3|nr:PEP-CTERM sorting domain-containing protein [Cerasicoccus maritimus]